MSGSTERLYVIVGIVVALTIAAVLAFVIYGPSVEAQGNPEPGCLVGNPVSGSDCLEGNENQAGGGIGCNPEGPRPCGRTGDPDDTLNNLGNVPGCTSVGDAVIHNPYCAQYSSPLRR